MQVFQTVPDPAPRPRVRLYQCLANSPAPALRHFPADALLATLLFAGLLCPILGLTTSTAMAQVTMEDPDPPAPPLSCPGPALASMKEPPADREAQPVVIYAEQLQGSPDQLSEARGRIELFRADQYVSTDRLLVDPRTSVVRFPEEVRYEDANVRIRSAGGQYGFVTESGTFEDVLFGITGSTANGAADSMSLRDGNRSTLQRIRLTTCPGDDPDWELSAKEIELRHDEGYGIAQGAKLELGGVPVLWAPWFTFPIDDRRKTGFLYPALSTANDNGLDIAAPFYWNIAPDQDATITPRWFGERGLMLGAEYRLLTRNTYSTLQGNFLPNDDQTGEDRWRYRFLSRVTFSNRWRGTARLERVSDSAYFQDFSGNLGQAARQFVVSDLGVIGTGRWWTLSAQLNDFQVLDEAVSLPREPYARFPRVAFRIEAPLGRRGLAAGLDSEFVYFDRELGVVGARLDLFPSLIWSVNRAWGFLRATGGYRYTTYALDRRGAPGDESPDRGLPLASLDAGLYLEKALANGDTQTLEPRVFYLYVPFEDQSELPDFDTGQLTFGYAQLFHTNRFIGADRQTDANQVTLALGTRNVDGASGRDRWSLYAGQILYLESPRVTLPNVPPPQVDSSPFLAQFDWHPLDRFSSRLAVEWSWEEQELNVGVAALDWSHGRANRLGFEYRFRRDRLEQFVVRYLWNFNSSWQAYSRVNWSIDGSELLEAQIGVEYESCCWALSTGVRRYLRTREGDYRDAFLVQLRLKGLGNVGRRAPPVFFSPAPGTGDGLYDGT